MQSKQKIMEPDYEEIVRQWYIRLRPEFLRRLTAKFSGLSLYDAENIYQDTFIAIQENLMRGRVREDTSWSSYIMTIGMNLASKEWRRVGKIDSADKGFEDEEDPQSNTARKVEDYLKTMPDSDEELPLYQNPEAQSLLGDELIHTPEPCGSLIKLFYYEDLSMDEIAERIGYKNATTAKSKKSQCMKDLIRRVKDALLRAGLLD